MYVVVVVVAAVVAVLCTCPVRLARTCVCETAAGHAVHPPLTHLLIVPMKRRLHDDPDTQHSQDNNNKRPKTINSLEHLYKEGSIVRVRLHNFVTYDEVKLHCCTLTMSSVSLDQAHTLT